MVEQIKGKIEMLKNELASINIVGHKHNLTLGEYEDKRRLEIISKIQVLTEILNY